MLKAIRPIGRRCIRSAKGAFVALLLSGVVVTGQAATAEAAPKSAIVVDARTGKTLYASDADGLRHPASLTKMMTLYMLFGELDRGRLTMSSRLKVSKFAAGQSPTKLGLKAGSTVSVRDAMLGLITRSANDAAVVIAENLAGSEPAFAAKMTQTARQMGMSKTTFRNASGLPNPNQWTTARDMATLGRALQERYPSYYRYFSTRSFVYNGRTIGNHNRLLGRVEGVDGIKTGYTRASGFNLVSSVKRDNRYIVATVLGGASGAARDKQMERLIETYIPQAYAGPAKGGSLIARIFQGKGEAPPAPAARPSPRVAQPVVAEADMVEMATLMPAPRARPNTQVVVAAVAPAPSQPVARVVAVEDVEPEPLALAEAAPFTDEGPRMVFNQGPSGKPVANPSVVAASVTGSVATADDFGDEAASDGRMVAQGDADDPAPVATGGSGIRGWIVQIAATPSEDGARSLLDEARAKGGNMLASATPVVEPVQKGSSTLYRARFAGFEGKDKARAACAYLKKRDVNCLAVPQ